MTDKIWPRVGWLRVPGSGLFSSRASSSIPAFRLWVLFQTVVGSGCRAQEPRFFFGQSTSAANTNPGDKGGDVDHQQVTTELLLEVTQIARQAGEAILKIYARVDPGVTYKKDDSPLTGADLASHERIMEGLKRLTADIPILSEEGAERPYSERRPWARFWLVDPLDGTKEFIKKNGEFTVNIALVKEGVPVLGVVYAPVLSRAYLGAQGLGAWRQEDGGEREMIRATGSGQSSLAVVASRSHAGAALEAFLAQLPQHHLVSMGSSLKLCLVSDGAADLYPRLGPTMEWDTGAAHAVVSAAGGEVLDFSGEPLRYNKENLLNPHFIVLGERIVPWQEAFAAAGLVQEISDQGV